MGLTKEQRANRKACVYFIRHPRDLSIRYIGVSTNPKLRRTCHFTSKYTNPKLAEWVQMLKRDGIPPLLDVVFEGLSVAVAERVEARLILLHTERGANLLQMTYRRKGGRLLRNLGGNSLVSFDRSVSHV